MISALPASPDAKIMQQSLVEVSPSTLTMLKVSSTTRLRADWSIAGEIFTSVVKKESIVAMFG